MGGMNLFDRGLVEGVDGGVTREELYQWVWNTLNDTDLEDFQFRGGYMRHGIVSAKIAQLLSADDLTLFMHLLERKARCV